MHSPKEADEPMEEQEVMRVQLDLHNDDIVLVNFTSHLILVLVEGTMRLTAERRWNGC